MSTNGPPPFLFQKFTDPQMGTFTVDVPTGWQTRGGFAHPMLGDRRPWFQTVSPNGVFVLNGDAEFPQSFCHFRDQFEGAPITLPAGGIFLNLKPAADRLNAHYLKNFGARRFGQFKVLGTRPRPDICQAVRAAVQRMGFPVAPSYQLGAVETGLELSHNGMTRAASLVTTAGFAGEYSMGMWAFWEGNVNVWVAPPQLAALAEDVRMRMINSYTITPKMMQIYQQDEAMIANNGMAANAAQWNWFAGQQAAHANQQAMGETIVNNYWAQQQSNDQMARSWEQNQSTIDKVFDNISDATLGRQRLADEAMGKSYEAPAGSNYYWVDQQTGQVIGTDTSNPPDLTRNYTQLKKL